MEDINKTIGKNLLLLRKNAKLTQLELAEKFNYSDKTISKWEAGESLPSIEILYNLCTFYGVTLDTLTQEELQIEKPKRKSITNRFIPTLPARLIITLLAVSAVWLVATILFVTFKITFAKNIGMFFMWAVPISCVVLVIFNSVWGRSSLLFYILSLLIWSTLACVHVQLLKYNLWMVYLLGIPLQVAVILWASLLKRPKKFKLPKQPKEKKKKEKKHKVKPTKQQKDASLKPEQILSQNETEANKNLSEKNKEVGKSSKENAAKQKGKNKKSNDDDDLEFDYIKNK